LSVVTCAPLSMSQFGFFNPMLDFRGINKGEARKYATSTAPIINLQSTIFEGTLDIIGNLESHAARRVTTISQAKGNRETPILSLSHGLVSIGGSSEDKRAENLGALCLIGYQETTWVSTRKNIR